MRFATRTALVLALVCLVPVVHTPARAAAESALFTAWKVAWAAYKFGEILPLKPLQRRVEKTLSIDITAPLDVVFAAYSDMENHHGRFPTLKTMITHEEFEQGGVHVTNYTSEEEVPVLGLPLSIHTHGQQRIYADYHYEVDTFSAPDVVYHAVVHFEALDANTTRVTEHLTFQTNPLLIDFTVSTGLAGHEVGMQALKRDIENGAL